MLYKKKKITNIFYLIIIILVLLLPINYLQKQIALHIPFISDLITYLIRFMYIIIIPSIWIFALINKRIMIDVYIMAFSLLLFLGITIIFFPQNIIFLNDIYISLLYSITIYMLIRTQLISLESIKRILIVSSRVLILLIVFITWIFGGLVYEDQYMSFSNALTIISLILLYSAISKKNYLDLIMFIIGSVMILIYGSRGGFIAIVLYLIILAAIFKRTKILLILGTSIIGFVIIHLFNFQDNIRITLSNLGIESRTIDFLSSNTLFYFDDRFKIYELLIREIVKNPIFGLGLAGDRYFLNIHFTGVNSTYAHNIILEIWLHYGLIIGTIIMSICIYIFFRGFIFNRIMSKDTKMFLFIFFVTSILQLFVSRSYLTEHNILFLLAISANTLNKQKGAGII